MNIKKPLFLIVALGFGLFLTAGVSAADQAAKPSDATKVSEGDQTEAKPAVPPAASPEKAKTFAKAVAVEPIFEFEPVLDGETVTHTFVIKNTGNAELKILKVRTG